MPDAASQCVAGELSPPIALWRLALEGADEAAILQAVTLADPAGTHPLSVLARSHATRAIATAGRLSALGADHTRIGTEAAERTRTRALFDRLGDEPDAIGMAAYTLGDPSIARQCTAEVVSWIEARLDSPCRGPVLDLGCGSGRISEVLAERGHHVLGVDVSETCLRTARRDGRAAYALAPGDILPLRPDSTAAIIAVDSFPYVVQASTAMARRLLRACGETLRTDGWMAILNLRYGAEFAEDASELRDWAADAGLMVAEVVARPFRIWDGRAFVLSRATRDGRT